ncbi:MAG: DUF4202 domain-containing protein [Alphaproteobacteria bacterium]
MASHEQGDGFTAAIAAIDSVNEQDPKLETTPNGEIPAALLYGQRMSRWLLQLAPDASVPLRLAVRAQHVGRWKIPRSDYPKGRDGYLQWRIDQMAAHAETAGAILLEVGFEAPVISKVQDLLQKKSLKRDPEAQALEDAACLVFLETEFDAFSERYDDDKVVDILQKTWAKMSENGHDLAGALVARLSERGQQLVERALSPPGEKA